MLRLTKIMNITVKVKKDVEVVFLQVKADVRYYEDATVNGVEDTEGDLIPCKEGETWMPKIDLATGKILNWKQGTTADIHYKVCDAGTYELLDKDDNVVISIDGYVPDIMCPEGEGFGDYIIMKVDENGVIAKWNNSKLEDFKEEDED